MPYFTTRIRQIGIIFKNLKRKTIKGDFPSSIWTLQGKWYKNGGRIAAMTSISTMLFMRANTESKNEEFQNQESKNHEVKNQDVTYTKNVVRELEAIVEERARYFSKEKYKNNIRSFFQKDEVHIKLDWDGVTFKPSLPIYEKEKEVEVVCITSETVFENKSKRDQHHKLSTEKKRSSVFESTLTSGYLIGSKVGLTLTIPVNLIAFSTEIEASKESSREFSLQYRENNVEKEINSLIVEDSIIVPRNSTTTVIRKSKIATTEYSFKTSIGVDGEVKVTFYNQNKKRLPGEFTIPIKTIIREEFPKHMREGTSKILVTGTVKIKNRIDGIVILHPSVKKSSEKQKHSMPSV